MANDNEAQSGTCRREQVLWNQVGQKLQYTGFFGLYFEVKSEFGTPMVVEVRGPIDVVRSIVNPGFQLRLIRIVKETIEENLKSDTNGSWKKVFDQFNNVFIDGCTSDSLPFTLYPGCPIGLSEVGGSIEGNDVFCDTKEDTQHVLDDDSRSIHSKPLHTPDEQHIRELAVSIGELIITKNIAYGNAFHTAGAFLSLLYPNGIAPHQMEDMLTIVRIFDKLKRIATDKGAYGESPFRDIAGYALLALEKDEKKS